MSGSENGGSKPIKKWPNSVLSRGNNASTTRSGFSFAPLPKEVTPIKEEDESKEGKKPDARTDSNTDDQDTNNVSDNSPPSVKTATSGSQEGENEGSNGKPWETATRKAKKISNVMRPLRAKDSPDPSAAVLQKNWPPKMGTKTQKSAYHRPIQLRGNKSTRDPRHQEANVNFDPHINDLKVGTLVRFTNVVQH